MCRLPRQGVPPAEAARAVRDERPPPPAADARAARPGGRARARPPFPWGRSVRSAEGSVRAAVRLDAPAVEDLLGRRLSAEDGLVTAWEEIIAPTLHAVGRKWATAGEPYVEVEHLLSWHVSSALRRLRPARVPPYPAVPPVLLACAPGEQHSLPIEALAAALGERGLPVRMFGADLPADALRAAVRRTGPRAVVLWSQSRSTADFALARSAAGIEWGLRGARGHSTVLLAGPGWGAGTSAPRIERLFGLRSGLEVIAASAAGPPPPVTGAGRAGPAAYGS